MIELPESYTLAEQMRKTLLGKRVTGVAANASPHKWAWFTGDPADYEPRLLGKTVTGSDSYGGMAELRLEEWRLSFCDGTNLRYYAPEAKQPEKHQLKIAFEDGSALVGSVQMYGALWLTEGDAYEGYAESSHDKVKPLDPAFDEAYFDELWSGVKPTLSVKAFLATEQRMPGVGNGVLQDILWNAGLHPKRKLQSMGDAEREKLYASLLSTLRRMRDLGGRDTEKDLYGSPGGYRTILSSKTLAMPCIGCGGALRREAYMGGNVYYCPACQAMQ